MYKKFNFNKGFSLAEMLLSLLIVSVVLAATMPVITERKITGNNNTYWMSTNNSDIYYGMGNTKVGIGTKTPTSKFSVVGDSNLSGNVTTTGTITTSKDISATGNVAAAGNITATGAVKAANYSSSDGSIGATGTFTDKDGHTVTVKNGLITAISN